MEVNYQSMSSCYGCTSCEGCTHRYGNPSALFDGVSDVNEPNAWACTAPGSYTNGIGQQFAVVRLAQRPTKIVLKKAKNDGAWVYDWVVKDFSLEEFQDDGEWWVIASVADADREKSPDQDAIVNEATFVKVGGSAPSPSWGYDTQEDWSKDYPDCAGSYQSPIALSTGDDIPRGTDKLSYAFVPLENRALANTGRGLQVGGNFGTFTLPGGKVYESRQFHFHFPAEHVITRSGAIDQQIVGELSIAHQGNGTKGNRDLLMLVIPLQLPKESEDQGLDESFFRSLGLLGPYPEIGGHTLPFGHAVDLNVFEKLLQGDFWYYQGAEATPPCNGNVHWVVLQQTARISGDVLSKLLQNPPNARKVQDLSEREVWISRLPGAESEITTPSDAVA